MDIFPLNIKVVNSYIKVVHSLICKNLQKLFVVIKYQDKTFFFYKTKTF